MPTIRLTRDTMNMVRTQALPGFTFVSLATDREDGGFDLPVDDEVAMVVVAARLPGESDDDVVARLVRLVDGPENGNLSVYSGIHASLD